MRMQKELITTITIPLSTAYMNEIGKRSRPPQSLKKAFAPVYEDKKSDDGPAASKAEQPLP